MDGTQIGRDAPATRSAAGPADGGAEEGWPVASGTTALSVAVPEVDAVVRGWRARYDTAARHGGVAHVTVLFPFLPRDLITAAERAALRDLFAAQSAFTLTFADCGRFPGVLYLVPEPAAPLRALTAEVARRWPSHPPYGGLFGELAPHLTVANSGGEDVHTRAEAHLRARLPVTARVDSVDLVVHEEGRWLPWLDFPLGR
ncbi:2'-5' RNA ligase family protein [Streptomyces tubbatahanensis]|uniref:2'-5' RNA ligase family protein n=1 Tax=Streptomyces tubbatahanensis TaxID=2923272 RepID=A0ABY3Y097_9ACTN|nr:2'-5' RNA ligase family protein [Streptomyces tubbatahanensis]UNT00208.1 2'-5' RNA ligase family protein [Streptomyces tubbatahanensis]